MSASDILGTAADGGELRLDLDRLIGTHLCAVANSGGGKSGLIRRLLEVTYGRVQHIVLDIEDEFYTLREAYGYVIAGGEGADAPATVDGAAALARAVQANSFSLIVQLNDLGPDAPAFVGAFLQSMITAPRELWRPVLVVIDEAHRFAPSEGATDATLGVKALTGQGRKRGFTAVLASQRIAKIAADVRGDVNNWLLGRVGQSLDRKAVADALGFAPSSDEARELQGLPDRHFWGFGPALTRSPTLFRVADVETTPVRPGQAKISTPPAPEALREILAGLSSAAPAPSIEPTEALGAGVAAGQALAARDAEIARLQDELQSATTMGDLLYSRGIVVGIGRARDTLNALVSEHADKVETPPVDAETVAALTAGPDVASFAAAAKTRAGATIRVGASPAADARKAAPAEADAAQLTPSARKMLMTFAMLHPRALTLTHAAKLAGVSTASSQWRANRDSLLGAGVLASAPALAEVYVLSERGLALPDIARATQAPGLDPLEQWSRLFTPAIGAMLRAIVGADEPLTPPEIARAAGVSPTSSTVGTAIRELRANGLIENTPDGWLPVDSVFAPARRPTR